MGEISARETEITRIAESGEARSALERHLEEVIEGAAFKGSPRSKLFLKHVVGQAIAGNFESLKERTIGTELFGRSPSYVTGEDAIVRVTANDVRKRLAQHYRQYGAESDFRINLPPGSYIPEIHYKDLGELNSVDSSNALQHLPTILAGGTANLDSALDSHAAQIPVAEASANTNFETGPSRGHSKRRWLSFTNVLAALNLALFALLLYGIVWMRSLHSGVGSVTVNRGAPVSVFPWSLLFGSSNPTHLITSDPDIVGVQILTGSSITVSDYANRIYIPAHNTLTPKVKEICELILRGDKASSVDTKIAVQVSALAQSNSRKVTVQSARSMQFSILRSEDNFIFLGSPRSDPWFSIFDDQLDFRFKTDNTGRESIQNVHPHQDEQTSYVPTAGGGFTGQSYGVVAFIQNPDQSGQVLLLAGVTAESTLAAGDLVTDLPRLSAALRNCSTPSSASFKHFELLLRVDDMAGFPSKYEVVSCHVLPETPAHY